MYTVGVDIGGTKIKIGLFSRELLIKEETIPTPQASVAERLITAIKGVVQDESIHAIGVASAGIVHFQKGMIIRAANVRGLEEVPLKSLLEKAFHVPVVIGNDANCAAWAEGEIGAAQSVDSYICVTLGTGIGGGIVHNHKLIHGKNGYGGEIGHMVIMPNGVACGCGRNGCWEAYASGMALEKMISGHPLLTEKQYRPKDLFEHYTDQPSCKEIVDQFIDYLCLGIANLQYIFDPDRIVIGGGMIDSGEHWWTIFLENLSRQSSIPIDVQRAKLKNNASMIGASYLALQE
ncbi:ROK family protein [Guptibacillus sedimenti]|uniref:ROK family protein n=1 Tax=Guptibacillus sedimenti TaxID=3025680 RepID=UPI00235EE867|nr:ROK family protein [Pseudalkalibacillus sedimenti]